MNVLTTIVNIIITSLAIIICGLICYSKGKTDGKDDFIEWLYNNYIITTQKGNRIDENNLNNEYKKGEKNESVDSER